MGAASKVLSVVLRIGELCSSVVVLGLVGRVLWHTGQAGVYADARLIFVTIVASISTFTSVILMAPFSFNFYMCPLDLIMFVLWLMSFIFLEILAGVNTCDGVWYYSYWGYYWGGWWRSPFIVSGPWDIHWSGCGSLRATLAFSFMGAMCFMFQFFLGAYVVVKYKEEKKRLYSREAYYNKDGASHQGGVVQDANTASAAPA